LGWSAAVNLWEDNLLNPGLGFVDPAPSSATAKEGAVTRVVVPRCFRGLRLRFVVQLVGYGRSESVATPRRRPTGHAGTLRRNGDEGPAEVCSSHCSTPRSMGVPCTVLATDEEVCGLYLDATPTSAHPTGPDLEDARWSRCRRLGMLISSRI
jgi:hypothetical protein